MLKKQEYSGVYRTPVHLQSSLESLLTDKNFMYELRRKVNAVYMDWVAKIVSATDEDEHVIHSAEPQIVDIKLVTERLGDSPVKYLLVESRAVVWLVSA